MLKPYKIIKTGLVVVALSLFTIVTITPGLCSQPKKVAVIPFSINSPQDLGFLQDGLFNAFFPVVGSRKSGCGGP